MFLRLAVLPVVYPHDHRIDAQVRNTDKLPTHLISIYATIVQTVSTCPRAETMVDGLPRAHRFYK